MKAGAIALILSAAALGTGVVALTREGGARQPQRTAERADHTATLAGEVAELRREVEALKARGGQPEVRPTFALPSGARAGGGAARPEAPREVADIDPALEAAVEVAVERKTDEVLRRLRAKEDKKPPIATFASTLRLSESQRAETERVVAEGQREMYRILEVPTADGTNLLEQVVEIAARGMAEPGKDHGFGAWLVRIVNEKVPGTNSTYAARIESLKQSMRTSFERDWSDSQYQEFKQWGVDPTEIQGVRDSPTDALMERITARARVLGAEIPAGGGRGR